jgi:K+-transporting ATPase ATPase C chain
MKAPVRIPASIAFLFWMTVLTGVLYPAAITLAAQLAFPSEANGSLVVLGGEVRGSRLLGQEFESPRYFHPRPSATGYAYLGSGASNLAPTSAGLATAVQARSSAWRESFGTEAPEEMVRASASGLDPEISLDAALAQASAVAAARSLGPGGREALVDRLRAEARASTSLIGPPRVNVLSMNIFLDAKLGSDPTGRGQQ